MLMYYEHSLPLTNTASDVFVPSYNGVFPFAVSIISAQTVSQAKITDFITTNSVSYCRWGDVHNINYREGITFRENRHQNQSIQVEA